MAHDFTVSVNAIIVKNKEILLVKREDRDMWRLPGVELEVGESIDEAVIKMAKDKLGLEVSIDRVVGLYSKPIQSELVVLFVLDLVRQAKPKPSGNFVAADYFPLHELPDNFPEKNQERVEDYKKGQAKVVIRTQISTPSSLKFPSLNQGR